MSSIKKLLSSLGLSDKESDVYIATLRIGTGSSADIAHAAKLQRTTTKSILERLQSKGFVTLKKTSQKHLYLVEDPGIVIQQQETKMDLMKDLFSQINVEFHTVDKKPKVEIFDSREGVVTLITKVINETKKGEKILTLESPSAKNYEKVMTDELFNILSKQKISKGIQTRSIIPRGESEYIRPKSLSYGIAIRVLPNNFAFTSSIWIFGKSIGFFSGNQVFAVVITHREMHDSFMSLFNFLWGVSEDI